MDLVKLTEQGDFLIVINELLENNPSAELKAQLRELKIVWNQPEFKEAIKNNLLTILNKN